MQGVGRSDHHGIERLSQQPVEVVECLDAELLADEGAHLGRRIVDAEDLELALQLQQIGNVLDLGDAARADHPDPDALHDAPPQLVNSLCCGLSLSLLWFHC